MAAGGQCCLAWLLPAHDAVLLSHLLLHSHLLDMRRLSITFPMYGLPAACCSSRCALQRWAHATAVHTSETMAHQVCLTLVITLCTTSLCAPCSQRWQSSFHLVLFVVCVLLSSSVWLLLRSPALHASLVSWALPRQCLQHSADALCKHCI